jgi:hypothetical protein
MSYVTHLRGTLTLDRPLAPEHRIYLERFAQTRHVRRDVEQLRAVPDPIREAVGLPIGPEGAYFIGEGTRQLDDSTVLDNNQAPEGQFNSLWCGWAPTADGTAIENRNTPAHDYLGWLFYIIDHFLKPWGYVLNGQVRYEGEAVSDFGFIVVDHNAVYTE